MNLFVTGGAGYVGSHCVRRLVAAGHRVTVFDSLEFGHRAAVDPGADFVQGNLADEPRLRDLLAPGRFDGALHFAAYVNVGESVTDPLKYYRNNVANTITLLEALRDGGVRRLVFSSTCAVYGVPPALPITEEMPKAPINPYGMTKLVVERMLADSADGWGLGSLALRYFNAAGASADAAIGEDHDPENHLIPIVLQTALGQRPHVSVFGTDYPTPDGSCLRDYVHVEDLADAHLRAIESIQPGRAEAFNVGTGSGHSVLEVLAQAEHVTGRPIAARRVDRRPGDPPALFADAARLTARLGWKPRYTDLRAIIESAWRWHSTHPQGYDDR